LDAEHSSLHVLFLAAFFLLFFALAYLAIFPNHESESFTTISWESPPAYVSTGALSDETGTILFSIRLTSFEHENTLYRVNVQFEGRTLATQNVSLNVNEFKRVDFSIPVRGTLDVQNQIHVVVTKPDVNASAVKDDALLELVGYFSNRS
jgi:uncharacterized membrane protein